MLEVFAVKETALTLDRGGYGEGVVPGQAIPVAVARGKQWQ
jgi:hypothetical protein